MTMTDRFYSMNQVREGESLAANAKGLEMFALMERAGQAVFAIGMSQYPSSEHWLVCCGPGNNGGDGYIVASLAKSVGMFVTVWQLGDPDQLKGDARNAYLHWLNHGGQIFDGYHEEVPETVDVIIDALLGTGISGQVRDDVQATFDKINGYSAPVISVDVPSGLCGDTGRVLGKAIHADHTVSFIGLKQGLVTGQARDYVGELHFAGLGVEDIFDQQNRPSARAICSEQLLNVLPSRPSNSHKGDYGKVLLVGGNSGMGGALILSAKATAKCGAGMVASLSHLDNVTPLLISIPEVMSTDWNDRTRIDTRLAWCDVLALGPGLGRDSEAEALYHMLSETTLPKVVDADALYFLAREPKYDSNRVITPHSAEAAKLLGISVEDLEADRYQSVQQLQSKLGGVVVLKGPGTLICDGENTWVCLSGNPGMASAGMGDVLTGVIASFLAQGLTVSEAARFGVLIHSRAGDQEAKMAGQRGLLASDIINQLRHLVN
jgi:ADP-dependent NAD(P)H-hydrate dehydratase / NAD(P)H-hydrate epimerase